MVTKSKMRLADLYISFIVPITITYIFSALHETILIFNNNRFYITNQCSWILTILAIILVTSTYFLNDKQIHAVKFYSIGIIIGIISSFLPLKGDGLLQTFISQSILIIGYAILILSLLMRCLFKKHKNSWK